MADLHNALKSLGPVQWSDVPLDNLPQYMRDHFTTGELICNSVPPLPQGEPFHSAQPHHNRPNAAKSAAELHVSTVQAYPPCKEHKDLQSQWGKPMKFSADKNPLAVNLYKMAGHDRHGAWFARRSVHEGIGFDKFRKAMIREFPHTMTVQGGPGAGAVRGLAGDRRIEMRNVDGVGTLQVYQLSGQMPPPVTPRDFVPLLMTTESGLSEKSGLEVEQGKKHVPRSFMIVSKPLEHPDAPERSSFVRGQYESVELIREIPLHRRKNVQSTPNLLNTHDAEATHGRDRGATISFAESRGDDAKGEQRDLHGGADAASSDEAELNPVEWIMITRSDPGGGIPRFLVERGTPEAMLGDVKKFLNWACSLDEAQLARMPTTEDLDDEGNTVTPSTGAQPPRQETSLSVDNLPNGHTAPQSKPPMEPPHRPASAPLPEKEGGQGGMFANLQQVVEQGLAAYAPQSISQQLHDYLHPTHAPGAAARGGAEEDDDDDEDEDDSDDDSSSAGSFISATETHRHSMAMEEQSRHPTGSGEDLSMASNSSREIAAAADGGKKLDRHDKEVLKLMKERQKLDRKLAKKRAEEEKKLQSVREKEVSEQDKARGKHEKEMQKAEEKHRKEMEKLMKKQESEARKAEEKRRKKEEQNKLNLVTRERDECRTQLDSFKRENKLLLERVEELQRENTVMANRLGKMAPDVLKGVREEVEGGRKRADSAGKRSMESAASSTRS
ncbi:hypothetical protein BAUCODRAFT_28851 [Baudoinia panamericana UAMH 10762]|uniref:DUF3074 domain-containing protein n=1 Tax=Baudoinia panamericana (strain UAMH 10762) TaxID=717646 RepID=M2M0I7_BAUPA|nr:uncharacterized protein BAUCODRAFT_28851 [Baudoinia panamericana UAMH 10762]EMD00498.1 hypothetical protein BAUCODRAFT_28851 [Baudoinia panamericana UAMH 10762]